MIRHIGRLFVFLLILVFSTCLYYFHYLKTYYYNGYQQFESHSSGKFLHTQVITTQYSFTDDLLKPGAGFKPTELLLYSAVSRNTTTMTLWDELSVFGWELKHLNRQVYTCCLLYPSGRLEFSPANRTIFRKRFPSQMIARRFVCDLMEDDLKERAIAVTLTAREKQPMCNVPLTPYVDIRYPYKQLDEIAIFAKILYGNLSARDLITWFEVHKLFGFNKVLMYPYRLNQNATRVLQYYKQLGLVEIIPFATPGPEYGLNLPPLGTENFQGWNYRQVSLMDGFERLQGYKYIVSFDVDEYIIPRRNESWMELFNRLFRLKPDAAAFYFRTYVYIKNWGPSIKTSPFTIGRYLKRTKLIIDRRKHISVPSRITEGGFNTHTVYPRQKYKTYTMGEKDAVLHHFRSCRPQWLKVDTKFPCNHVTQFYDNTVNNLFIKVEDDVLNLVSKLQA